jgi:hypothetical protein
MKRLCLLLAVLAIVPSGHRKCPAKSLKIALIAKSESNFVFLAAVAAPRPRPPPSPAARRRHLGRVADAAEGGTPACRPS